MGVKSSDAPGRGGYHHGDLRNALLARTLALVAAKGQEGFSLREAARAVGVSASAAYRHFADKTALLVALAAEGHGRLATAMERAVAEVPGPSGTRRHAAAVLRATGRAYVEFAVRNPSHFRVMFGPCIQEEGFAPGRSPSGRDAFRILVDALDGLVATGALRAEAREGAEVVAWSTVHGLAALLVDGALPVSVRERAMAVDAVTRNVLVGLGCDPALAPAGPPLLVPPQPRKTRGRARPPE
jgi:AcrR family transcriptional regulator